MNKVKIRLYKEPNPVSETDKYDLGANLFTDCTNGTFENPLLINEVQAGAVYSMGTSLNYPYEGTRSLRILSDRFFGMLWSGTTPITLTLGKSYLVRCMVYVENPYDYIYKPITMRIVKKPGGFDDVQVEPIIEWKWADGYFKKWIELSCKFHVTSTGGSGTGNIGTIGVAIHRESMTALLNPHEGISYKMPIDFDQVEIKEILGYSEQYTKPKEVLYSEELDCSNLKDLATTYSIKNVEDAENITNYFSKNIVFPGTKRNNQAFKNHAEIDLNIDQLITRDDLRAQIDVNDLSIIRGILQVLSSKKTKDIAEYETFLTGSNKLWVNLIKDKNIREIFCGYQECDFLKWVSTWNNVASTYLSNSILSNSVVGTASTSSVIFAGIFDYNNDLGMDNNNPTCLYLDYNDLRPSFYAFFIFKKIFEEIGYTVVMNGQFFSALGVTNLLLPYVESEENNGDEGIVHTEDWFHRTVRPLHGKQETELVIDTIISDVDMGGWHVYIRQETPDFTSGRIIDNSNQWVDSGALGYYSFDSRSKGDYELLMSLSFLYGIETTQKQNLKQLITDVLQQGDRIQFYIKHYQAETTDTIGQWWTQPGHIDRVNVQVHIVGNGGTVIKEYNLYDSSEPIWNTESIDPTAVVIWNNINGTYTVRWRDNFAPGDPTPPFEFWTSSKAILKSDLNWGTLYTQSEIWTFPKDIHYAIESPKSYLNLKEYLPDMTQPEFIKSIIIGMDLMVEPNEFTKTITFTQRKEYYKNSILKIKDWTPIFNSDKQVEISEVEVPYKGIYHCKYTEDSGDKVVEAINQEFVTAGLLNTYGNYAIRKNKNSSEESTIFQIAFAPTAMKQFSNGVFIPCASQYGLTPRILLYGGMRTGGLSITHGNSGTVTLYATYPSMYFYHKNAVNNLSFSPLKNSIASISQYILNNEINLYNLIDLLLYLRLDARKLTGYFSLQTSDIVNLKFSDYIKLKEDLFILDEITDYSVLNNRASKATLISLTKVFESLQKGRGIGYWSIKASASTPETFVVS